MFWHLSSHHWMVSILFGQFQHVHFFVYFWQEMREFTLTDLDHHHVTWLTKNPWPKNHHTPSSNPGRLLNAKLFLGGKVGYRVGGFHDFVYPKWSQNCLSGLFNEVWSFHHPMNLINRDFHGGEFELFIQMNHMIPSRELTYPPDFGHVLSRWIFRTSHMYGYVFSFPSEGILGEKLWGAAVAYAHLISGWWFQIFFVFIPI